MPLCAFMSDAPTLKDVAKKMGLSITAVSLGLRRAGNISEATCKRIAEVAREMGYRPNPYAAALSTRVRTGDAKGVPLAVLQRPLKQGASLYPIMAIVDGITERSAELGYRAECFKFRKYTELPTLLNLLHNRGFLGVFLPPIGADSPLGKFDWSPFSVVGCGRYDQTSVFHTVRQEIFESTRLLLDEMIRSGYKRICMGLLKHDPALLDDFARVAVAAISAPSGGRKVDVFFSELDGKLSGFVDRVKAIKADAVIGFSPAHYYALVDAGIRVPQDVAFATLHNDPAHVISMAGLSPLDKRCGIVAANRMDTMIRHHERGIPLVAEQIAIRSEWHPGATLPPAQVVMTSSRSASRSLGASGRAK